MGLRVGVGRSCGLRVGVGDRGLLEVGDRCCQKGELRGDRMLEKMEEWKGRSPQQKRLEKSIVIILGEKRS